MKKYELGVSHDFWISNETDSDSQSDYFPGMWGIKTQKTALEFAQELIEEGNQVRVKCYNNNFKVANKFIVKLGLDQPLFETPSYGIASVNALNRANQ